MIKLSGLLLVEKRKNQFAPGKKNFFERTHWDRRNCWNKSIFSHLAGCRSWKRIDDDEESFLHGERTNELLLVLLLLVVLLLVLDVDGAWMFGFETAATDDDDDGKEKRCWWQGRPFRIKTGTATRRGDANDVSSKSSTMTEEKNNKKKSFTDWFVYFYPVENVSFYIDLNEEKTSVVFFVELRENSITNDFETRF